MKITDIDKNFIQQSSDDDTVWLDVKKSPFKIYGLLYDEEDKIFRRIPKSISTQISQSVYILSDDTAGGRLLFKTTSSSLSIKCVLPNYGPMPHMPITGSNGFSIYVDGKFYAKVSPACEDFYTKDEYITYTAKVFIPNDGNFKEIKIYFPLYGRISQFFVGLESDCQLEKAKEYKYTRPVVYYGSSITQGGCASRPGNDYLAYIERWLDTDFINLGFSGSAKGELTMADYISSLNPSIVVIDYDHNATTPKDLKETHYPFYKRIRNALPSTPIIFISRPDFYKNEQDSIIRREVIKDTYLKSVKENDANTDFIDGQTLFGQEDYDSCTVDGCHPNDLGFYRMAKTIYPFIKKNI